LRIVEHEDRTSLIVAGPVRLGEVAEWLALAQRAAARGMPVEIDLREAEHMHAAAWQVTYALVRELRASGTVCTNLGMSASASNACVLLGLDDQLLPIPEIA
jgi:anti-anti-sigma regulatory factor